MKFDCFDLVWGACVSRIVGIVFTNIPGLAHDVIDPLNPRFPHAFVCGCERGEVDWVAKGDFLKRVVFVGANNVSE